MKFLSMPQQDAHKYIMGTVDLSKQLEKGHKRYSCLIYIFPPGNIGAEGHSQRDGVTFVPTAPAATSAKGKASSCCPLVGP